MLVNPNVELHLFKLRQKEIERNAEWFWLLRSRNDGQPSALNVVLSSVGDALIAVGLRLKERYQAAAPDTQTRLAA